MDREIIYAGDPLCAWCFGFTENFEKIIEKYSPMVSFSMIMGGLRVESPVVIDKPVKEALLKNWTGVSNKTGQEISIDRIGELPEASYSSEPPCRAVVTVRTLMPQSAVSYYKSIHRAFYIEMKNINDPELLCELAYQAGVPKNDFLSLFNSEEMASKTQNDFLKSEEYGVLGFPALILKDHSGAIVLNQGYKPLDSVVGGIEQWLKGLKPGFL